MVGNNHTDHGNNEFIEIDFNDPAMAVRIQESYRIRLEMMKKVYQHVGCMDGTRLVVRWNESVMILIFFYEEKQLVYIYMCVNLSFLSMHEKGQKAAPVTAAATAAEADGIE